MTRNNTDSDSQEPTQTAITQYTETNTNTDTDTDTDSDEEQLTYTVQEYTTTTSAGGWGKREITKQRLSRNKPSSEMTERERSLHLKIDTDRVPGDADVGDTLTVEDLLDDPRTRQEKEEDALDAAAETGEEVVVSSSTQRCNTQQKECNIDHVTTVATPDGDIETRRQHTY